MPEFFAFTLGAETSPRVLREPETTAPLLVGRFRAVVGSSASAPASTAGTRPSTRHGHNPHQPHVRHLQRHQRWPLWGSRRRNRSSGSLSWPRYGAVEDEDEDDGYDEDDEDEEEEEEEEDDDDYERYDDNENGAPAKRAANRAAPLRWNGAAANGERAEAVLPHRRPLWTRATHALGRGCRRSYRRVARHLRDLWLTPRPVAVRRAVAGWWTRWALLVVLPAALAVTWCALPVPQWPLEDYEDDDKPGKHHRAPAHGEARVRLSFWFFLFAYYGPYNATALVWITKVFNLYGLNWWPPSLGFARSTALLAAVSLAVPAVLWGTMPRAAASWLAAHNTAWTTWTFMVMAMPAGAALVLLLRHERHLGLRQTLSATQQIFTTATWAGEESWRRGGRGGRGGRGRRPSLSGLGIPDETTGLLPPTDWSPIPTPASPALRRAWLPASFVRFLWLMSALFTSLMVFELGEASASLFLAALPGLQHETVYALVYVWGWTVTVFLLDMLTSWILGGHQGERVGSYPLGWVFKLYFMLTYQTYVRALYARLRSPSQVVFLQILSSSTLIVLTPLLMSPWTHRLLVVLGLNGLAYPAYQKVCARNVFVRFIAENATMIAFLGALLVLHFGPNRDVYPYFAFDDVTTDAADTAPPSPFWSALLTTNSSLTSPEPYTPYTFSFTLYAASITWACELVAAVVVSSLLRCFYGVAVVSEAKADLAAWPELLPATVAVAVHVLQNMLFSIIRLRF